MAKDEKITFETIVAVDKRNEELKVSVQQNLKRIDSASQQYQWLVDSINELEAAIKLEDSKKKIKTSADDDSSDAILTRQKNKYQKLWEHHFRHKLLQDALTLANTLLVNATPAQTCGASKALTKPEEVQLLQDTLYVISNYLNTSDVVSFIKKMGDIQDRLNTFITSRAPHEFKTKLWSGIAIAAGILLMASVFVLQGLAMASIIGIPLAIGLAVPAGVIGSCLISTGGVYGLGDSDAMMTKRRYESFSTFFNTAKTHYEKPVDAEVVPGRLVSNI